MARYVNAEDVEHLILENLDALSKLIKTAKGTDREKLFFKEMGLTDALAHLREVPTADVREVINSAWIPVSERLPDIDMSYPHSDSYLVCTDKGEIGVVFYSNMNIIFPQYVTEPRWDVSKYTTVIAWMPLPSPYTADNPKWEELPYKGENIERGNGLP